MEGVFEVDAIITSYFLSQSISLANGNNEYKLHVCETADTT